MSDLTSSSPDTSIKIPVKSQPPTTDLTATW